METLSTPFTSDPERALYNFDEIPSIDLQPGQRQTKSSNAGSYFDVNINPMNEHGAITYNNKRVNASFILPMVHVPFGVDCENKTSYEQYKMCLNFDRDEISNTFTNNWVDFEKKIKAQCLPEMLKTGYKGSREFKNSLYIPFNETGEEDLSKNRRMYVKLFKYTDENTGKTSQSEIIDITGRQYSFEELVGYKISGFPIVTLTNLRSSPQGIVQQIRVKTFIITDIVAFKSESKTLSIVKQIAEQNPDFVEKFKRK